MIDIAGTVKPPGIRRIEQARTKGSRLWMCISRGKQGTKPIWSRKSIWIQKSDVFRFRMQPDREIIRLSKSKISTKSLHN